MMQDTQDTDENMANNDNAGDTESEIRAKFEEDSDDESALECVHCGGEVDDEDDYYIKVIESRPRCGFFAPAYQAKYSSFCNYSCLVAHSKQFDAKDANSREMNELLSKWQNESAEVESETEDHCRKRRV